MGREGSFQSSALSYLNGLPGCKAENVSGNASQSGRPDITGCYQGRMFKLELKSPDHRNKPSKKQRIELRRWGRSGCVVGVIYSMKSLRRVFELMDWNQDYNQEYYNDEEPNGCCSWALIPTLKEPIAPWTSKGSK